MAHLRQEGVTTATQSSGQFNPAAVTSGGQKVKTGALSLLGKVGDFLSRGNFASANVAKAALEGKVSWKNLLPGGALYSTVTGKNNDALLAAWNGLKGKDKTTYSDVLDKMGWKAGSGGMANKVARGVVSFGLDVALDPTTYLSMGTGAGAKIVGKKSVTTLTKAGSKELAELAIKKGSREAAEVSFEKLLSKSPEMALKYVDKGGIKFAGQTIVDTAKISQPIKKIVSKVTSITEVKNAVDKIGGMFNRDYLAKGKPLLQRTVQSGRDLKTGLIQQMDERVTKDIGKKFTQIEKENVGRAIWSGDVSTLTKKEQQLNAYIQKDYAKYFKQEKLRGRTAGEIEGDYLNQMYENPEVLQELKKSRSSEFAKGTLIKTDPFTNKRTVNSLAQAERLGLKPIFDVEKLLKARLSHSISTVIDHDMALKVLELEGVASKVKYKKVIPDKEGIKQNKIIDQNTLAGKGQPTTGGIRIGEQTTPVTTVKGGATIEMKPMSGRVSKQNDIKSAVREITGTSEKNSYLIPKPGSKEIKVNTKLKKEKVFIGEPIKPQPMLPGKTLERLPETKVIEKYKVNPVLGSDMVKATSVPGLSKIKGAEKVHIPVTTAKYLESLTPKVVDMNSGLNRFLKQYDNYTNMFKKNVLTLFPAYHSRNFRGNIFQTILEYGVVDATNPKFHAYSMKVLKGTDLKAMVSIGGKDYSVGELRKIMQENGILQGKGFFDLSNPMKQGDKSLFSYGQKTASYIENQARAATFLMGLEHSKGDILTAAERTKKTLFDYDNLSDMEKNVFKRIFPFYTWTRKAMESTINGMAKNPGNMASIFKIMNNVQKNSFEGITEQERATLPDYLKNSFVFKVKGKDGVIRYKSGMGAPIEAITDLLSDPSGNLSFALNPGLKALMTVITKYDFDNGKPLKEVTTKNAQILKYAGPVIQKWLGYGEVKRTDGTTTYTANPFALYVLRQPPFSRYVSTAGTLTNEGKDRTSKFMQSVFGINATNQDMERQMKEYENKYKDDITKSLRQKGVIVKNQYGVYYIPKDIVLSPSERAAAEEILKITKDVNYAPNVGSDPLKAISGKTTSVPKPAKIPVRSKYQATLEKQKKNKSKSMSSAINSIQGRVNF